MLGLGLGFGLGFGFGVKVRIGVKVRVGDRVSVLLFLVSDWRFLAFVFEENS